MKNLKNNQKGFTLIEILVVIGMIALLAAIVLIAINPARQFAQGRNAQRINDVTAILNAVGQYTADNKGTLPANITIASQEIKNGAADICAALMPTYVSSLPVDPQTGSAYTTCPATYATNYFIQKDTNGRITVTANGAELGSTITVTR
jgi:prepilin-type N-terminal cleavage/methylation domain-containing protein